MVTTEPFIISESITTCLKAIEFFFQNTKYWVVLSKWHTNLLVFWKNNSIAFKQVVMDSDIINGSVVTDETVIAKILNKNQWCHHGKMLT